MARRTLVHGRLLASLADFYPSAVTIQHNMPVVNTLGVPVAGWTNLTRHVSLSCAVGPPSVGGAQTQEERRANRTVTKDALAISLQGHYPQITTAMRAIVDGLAYDIVAVEHDSHGVTTRLLAQLAIT